MSCVAERFCFEFKNFTIILVLYLQEKDSYPLLLNNYLGGFKRDHIMEFKAFNVDLNVRCQTLLT